MLDRVENSLSSVASSLICRYIYIYIYILPIRRKTPFIQSIDQSINLNMVAPFLSLQPQEHGPGFGAQFPDVQQGVGQTGQV